MRTTLVALLVLAGCAAPGEGPIHDLSGLEARDGARISLETDLDADLAKAVLERLEKTEKALDEKQAWLAPRPGRVKVLVVGDEGRYREIARSHGVTDPALGAFACSAGEVVVRFRPEEWGQGPQEGWFLAPRSAPVSEALFRQRLELTYGPSLERTRLEDGCARFFVAQAARELGEAAEANRRERDDLLAAYLPIFLGGGRVVASTAEAKGTAAEDHGSKRSARLLGAPSLSYAVARYLVEAEGGQKIPLLRAVFRGATDEPATADHAIGPPGAGATSTHDRLDAEEDRFARWLRDRTVDALLDALGSEPIPAARWEARSALRLIAQMDIDETEAASPDELARRLGRARIEARKVPTVRFTEEFDAQLLAASRSHGGLEKIVGVARAELERRAAGFGHPAIEEGKTHLGAALEGRLRALTAPRTPG